VGIIENIRAREAYDWCKATAFNRRAPPPPIREFRTPVLDFKAKTYVTMAPLKLVKGDYDGTDAPKLYKFKAFSLNSTVAKATLVPITEPPLTMALTMDDLRGFIESPYTCDYPCHTQAVEHGVAAVSRAVKQRRCERTQLIQVRQTAAAIKKNPGPITRRKKRMLSDI
jgi:hypothetical protein